MFCTNCGHQVSENVAFCTNCGAKLKAPANRAGNEGVFDDGPAFQTKDSGAVSETTNGKNDTTGTGLPADQTGQIAQDGAFPPAGQGPDGFGQDDTPSLNQEFDSYINVFIARLNHPACGVSECTRIFEELQTDKQGITRVVDELNNLGKFDEKADEYITLCYELANKFYGIHAAQNALAVIDYARSYGPGKELEAKLNNLEKSIKNGPPVQPQPAPVQPQPAPVQPQPAPVQPQPAPVQLQHTPVPPQPTPVPPTSKPNNKKLMMIGAAAALVIVAGGLFLLKGKGSSDPKPPKPPVGSGTEEKKNTVPMPEEKKVGISFTVPEGTKVLLDGKDVGSGQNLQVAVGPHDVKLVHPLLEFDYDQKLTVAKNGEIAPVKKAKLGSNAKTVAEKTSVAMMNEILQQACSSNSITLNPSVFTAKADANGKITKAHQAMRRFASQNSLKNLPVSLVSLGNLELIDSNRKIRCQPEFSGQGVNGRTIVYTAQIVFEIKGGQLLVDSLEHFKGEQN